ncbi:MAG: SDR family NAD(P)-dependent oxidoreductase [Pseudomonadota bacterium]
MSARIQRKTIVITGASSGIGAAAAQQLAARGARLCLVARREDELRQVQAAIEARGGQCWVYPADLTEEKSLDACAAAILAEHPRVDVLVNNAGRSIRRLVSESFDRFHDYQRTMQINYFAPVRLTQKLLPQMLARNSGHLINVSSYSTLVPVPRFAAYVASKMALEGFSQSLAAEMVGKNIHVTLIHYPLVKTPMTAPTAAYKYIKQMDVDEAAGWIVTAIEKRPARMATRIGEAWGVAQKALPLLTTALTGRLLMNRAKKLATLVAQEQKAQSSGS